MIQNNTATSFQEEVCTNKGGLKLQGQWKQHARDDQGNTAGQAGGGIVLFSGADVLIESGAHL